MKKLLLITSFTFLFWSCSEKNLEPSTPKTTAEVHSGARTDTPYLDWENLDRFPIPGGNTVANPWSTLVSNQYNDQIRFDYKKSDGWVLLYNTFSADGSSSDPLIFMLYNKYRGVVRIYDYVKPIGGFIDSDNLVHTFKLSSSQSNLLSYSGKEIVDLNEKPTLVSQVESFQVAPETWYACEFELAYDPNISTYNYQSLRFDWNFKGRAISAVTLNGQIDLKGTGSFTSPSVDLTVGAPSITINKGSNVTHGADETKSFLQRIGSSLADGFSEGLTGLASKAVSSLFNMLTGNSDDKSSINLDLNGSVNVTGNIQNDFLVHNLTFALPGYDQTNTSGPSPYDNHRPGIFTLTGVPAINRQLKTNTGNNTHYAIYSVDKSSFDITFNPDLLQYADITNVEKLIVWDHKREVYSGVFYQSGSSGYAAGSDTYTGDSFLSLGYNFNGDDLGNTAYPSDNLSVYVKVSFTVVPKDGGSPVYIVKTFYPNYIINTTPYTGPLPG